MSSNGEKSRTSSEAKSKKLLSKRKIKEKFSIAKGALNDFVDKSIDKTKKATNSFSTSMSRAHSRDNLSVSSKRSGVHSLPRGLLRIKDVIDIHVLQKNKDAPTIDDVFHEQAILPPINKSNFSGEFDWGQNWASMDEFEHAVSNLNFKTVQLTELFKEVACAQHKYSKRIGEIANSHLRNYQKLHKELDAQPHAEYSKHEAIINLFQYLLKVADNNEVSHLSMKATVEEKFSVSLADAQDKLKKISTSNKNAKKELKEQLNRVKHAKSNFSKRSLELDKAEDEYSKFTATGEDDIKREDRLRVTVDDKKALVARAKTEHDNQVASYNNLQANYYENDLPEFCRREFEVHQLLTESWKKSLMAFSQCQTRLIEQVRNNTSEVTEFFEKIEKELDSNILFKNVEIKKDQVPPTPLNTIEDLEQFKFPDLPSESDGEVSGRKVSVSMSILTTAEQNERLKQIENAGEFITLKDGRSFKRATVIRDFEGGFQGAMSVEEGAHVGISTAELFKYKDVRDGWIKVVNLLTEDNGYVPFAYIEYAE